MSIDYKNQIISKFGAEVFESPLFYSYPGGLRFELSQPGYFSEIFISAYNRANEIAEHLFEPDSELILYMKGGSLKRTFLGIGVNEFRALKQLSLMPEKNNYQFWWGQEIDKDFPTFYRLKILSKISKELLPQIIWNSCTWWQAIEPSAGFEMRIFSLKQNICMYIYDDRGMDVVGPNFAMLKELYHKFNSYILEYDRDEIEQTFR